MKNNGKTITKLSGGCKMSLQKRNNAASTCLLWDQDSSLTASGSKVELAAVSLFKMSRICKPVVVG